MENFEMSNLENLMVDLEKFVVAEKDIILPAAIIIVLIIGFCLWMRKNRKDRQDEEEMTFQPETYETQQPEAQQSTNAPVDPSILETCRKRANELFALLEGSQKYVKFFDEELELSGDGYMYALMRMVVDGLKIWVIFYPNTDYDIAVMVFDRKIPWNVIMENKAIIDEFYDDDEGELFGEEDEYPAYVWADGNYDYDIIVEDLTSASQADLYWSELLLQFQDEDDDADDNDE